MAEKHRIRKKELKIRLTEKEHLLYSQKAKEKDMTMSDFIRHLIMEGVIIKYEPFDMKLMTKRLNYYGNRINHIAKRINERQGDFTRKDIDDLAEEIANLRYEVYEIIGK